MTTRVRARYANGVLIPFFLLDLAEGCEFDITVNRATSPRTFAEYLDWVKRLHDSIPAERWDELPADGAKNFRDYRGLVYQSEA